MTQRSLRRPPRPVAKEEKPSPAYPERVIEATGTNTFVYPRSDGVVSVDNKVIKGIWVGDPLSDRELLCIRSYLANGHDFHLYTYDEHTNLPAGTVVKDANEIIPKSEISTFHFRANFCDLFRYSMLAKYGGWYVDMDSVCLKPLNFSSEYVFGTCGCDPSGSPVNLFCDGKGCYIGNAFMKVPANSPIMEFCRDYLNNTLLTERRGVDQAGYDVLGPRLLQKAISKFGMERGVQPPIFFDPIPCYNAAHVISPDWSWDLRSSYVVHLNGAQWNKNYHSGRMRRGEKYPDMSLYSQLMKRYL